MWVSFPPRSRENCASCSPPELPLTPSSAQCHSFSIKPGCQRRKSTHATEGIPAAPPVFCNLPCVCFYLFIYFNETCRSEFHTGVLETRSFFWLKWQKINDNFHRTCKSISLTEIGPDWLLRKACLEVWLKTFAGLLLISDEWHNSVAATVKTTPLTKKQMHRLSLKWQNCNRF